MPIGYYCLADNSQKLSFEPDHLFFCFYNHHHSQCCSDAYLIEIERPQSGVVFDCSLLPYLIIQFVWLMSLWNSDFYFEQENAAVSIYLLLSGDAVSIWRYSFSNPVIRSVDSNSRLKYRRSTCKIKINFSWLHYKKNRVTISLT